ncbi:MAG: hypothetical protein ACJAS4_001849 [Bacteriovoracaceae bacterium]|jgi:hypothetical protein
MKIFLKTIALCLAIAASAQTVKSYADSTKDLPELIKNQEHLLTQLLSGSKVSFLEEDGTQIDEFLTDNERKELLIKNMVHYIRLLEGEETLIDEIKDQVYPDLDVNGIINGRSNPGI